MAEEKHYVNEVGTDVIVDCGRDISTSSARSLSVMKPGATAAVTWTASVHTIDGHPNYLKHTTGSGDFSVPGDYEVQAVVTIGTFTGRGVTSKFVVYENFS